MPYLGDPNFLKVVYLSFKFKQYPRTESGQLFGGKEMESQAVQGCFFFPSKTGRNWGKKKHMESG